MKILINYKTGSMSFPSVESRLNATFDSKFRAGLVSFKKRFKISFKIFTLIIRAEFDLKKTNAITKEDLSELCYRISESSEDEKIIYDELIHYNHKDAVFLQIHNYFWLQENSYLTDPEIALLMVIIYERLFAYNLQEVYDTLQSLNPAEDDIDDYSNSTIEVYGSSEFSDYDCEFQTFISEMINCLESYVFINNQK